LDPDPRIACFAFWPSVSGVVDLSFDRTISVPSYKQQELLLRQSPVPSSNINMGWSNLFHWYKTPSRVDLKQTVSLLAQNENIFASWSPRQSLDLAVEKGGIPRDLALDRVLANKTCTPMSLHDFHMYLEHIEYSPENLELYLW